MFFSRNLKLPSKPGRCQTSDFTIHYALPKAPQIFQPLIRQGHSIQGLNGLIYHLVRFFFSKLFGASLVEDLNQL